MFGFIELLSLTESRLTLNYQMVTLESTSLPFPSSFANSRAVSDSIKMNDLRNKWNVVN